MDDKSIGYHDIHVVQHTQKTLTRRWGTGVPPAAFVPMNLTGYAGRFYAFKRGTTTPLVNLTTGGNGIVITGAAGEIEVDISRAALAVPPGEYLYYLIVIDPNGRDRPLLTGRFVVEEGLPQV